MNLLVGLAGAPLPEDEDQLNTPPTNTDHRRRKKDKIHNLTQSIVSPSATVKPLYLNSPSATVNLDFKYMSATFCHCKHPVPF